MAIDKQTAPLDSPASLLDWQRLIDITDTLALSFKNPWPVKVVTGTGYIIRGSVFYIGGAWYKANVDVAITGTETDYIQLTVDNINNLVTAVYVATLVDVSWNDQWNGWYDTNGKFYVFDEAIAYGAGLIDFPRTVAYSRPKNAESAKALSTPMGKNWSNVLAQDCDTTASNQIIIGLPSTLYPQYNRNSVSSKGATSFADDSWKEIYRINLNVGINLSTITGFRFVWANEDSSGDNYIRIMDGANPLIVINDRDQANIPIDVTGLSFTSNKQLSVQYKARYPSSRGPFTLLVQAGCVDDSNKPNILEYAFNAATAFLATVVIS